MWLCFVYSSHTVTGSRLRQFFQCSTDAVNRLTLWCIWYPPCSCCHNNYCWSRFNISNEQSHSYDVIVLQGEERKPCRSPFKTSKREELGSGLQGNSWSYDHGVMVWYDAVSKLQNYDITTMWLVSCSVEPGPPLIMMIQAPYQHGGIRSFG